MQLISPLCGSPATPRSEEIFAALAADSAMVASHGQMLVAEDFDLRAQYVVPGSITRDVLAGLERLPCAQLMLLKAASRRHRPTRHATSRQAPPRSLDRAERMQARR